jgi:signal transduction histidine kinase
VATDPSGAAPFAELAWFAGRIAHELANTCNPLTLNAQLLQMVAAAGDAADVATASNQLENGARRLIGNVTSLRAFARFPAEGPAAGAADVGDLLASWVDSIDSGSAGTRVVLAEPAASDLPPLRCDPAAFQAVLRALADNATEAGAGQVTIGAGCSADALTITVEDNGQGVDRSIAGRMFEPFVSGRRQAGHLGLGLWLAAGLCQRNGMQLRWDPQAVGCTRFVLRQPRVVPPGGT